MKLLIIDTETTNIEAPEICEISASIYHIGKTKKDTGMLNHVSTLITFEGKKEIESINDISSELTQFNINYQEKLINVIKLMAKDCKYAIAFNAEFDAPIVNSFLDINLNWLCAMKDINWGYYKDTFKLTDLALWLGIGISTIHRAGDDVRLLCECFNRRKEALPKIIEDAIILANSPLVEVKALVSFQEKEKAKEAGFFWDINRKIWFKRMRQIHVNEFIKPLDFQVAISDDGHY